MFKTPTLVGNSDVTSHLSLVFINPIRKSVEMLINMQQTSAC